MRSHKKSATPATAHTAHSSANRYPSLIISDPTSCFIVTHEPGCCLKRARPRLRHHERQ